MLQGINVNLIDIDIEDNCVVVSCFKDEAKTQFFEKLYVNMKIYTIEDLYCFIRDVYENVE